MIRPPIETREFARMVQAIATLEEARAEHRDGFRIGSALPREILVHAISEIVEIIEAQDGASEIREFGDAFACLLAAAHQAGITTEAIAAAWCAKLPGDFPGWTWNGFTLVPPEVRP